MSLNVCVIVDDLYMYAVTAAAVEIIGKENPTTKELETMQIKEKKKIKNIIFYISNQFCNIFVLIKLFLMLVFISKDNPLIDSGCSMETK